MAGVQISQQRARRPVAAVALLLATVVALGAAGQVTAAASTVHRSQVDDPNCGTQWPSLRASAVAPGDDCTSGSGDTSGTTSTTVAPTTSQATTSTTVRATSTTTTSSTILTVTSEAPPASVLGATTVVTSTASTPTTSPSATVLAESESRSVDPATGELAQTGRTTGPLTMVGAALVLGGALLLALRARRAARSMPYSSIV